MHLVEWLLRPLALLFGRHPDLRDAVGRLLVYLGTRFYAGLAALLILLGAWNLFAHPFDNLLARESFDLLMRERPIWRPGDPDIVVLDIDEASLAALNGSYGRWPWPRRVLGEVSSKLEQAGARAVMFDILFTDEDKANPDSEAAFAAYVQSSRHSFFPAVRLNPANDGASEIPVSMLKFAQPAGAGAGARTVAIMTPYFASIYDSTRVGTNNIRPDRDNVVRWYTDYEDLDGYRIPSLPYRVAQALGWPLPVRAHNLINWPKGLRPYRTIGFATALEATKRGDEAFFQAFRDRVVLIGSTAPSLNDLKATPISPQHPGIYVLATVTDNLKNGHYLRPLHPVWVWLLEVVLLAGSAALFIRTRRAPMVAKYFYIVPAVLLVISFASVSLTETLVDLSVPAALVLAYFTLAKMFDTNLREYIAGHGPFAASAAERQGSLQIACLPASVPRAEVLRYLTLRGAGIKLWEPEEAGLGRLWNEQGWVLWRWSRDPAAAGADAPPALIWKDVAAESASDGFSLAESIANAARAAQGTA